MNIYSILFYYRKLDAFNLKVTSNYQIDTADRFGRMEHIVDDRADIHAKMCAVVKNSHDHVRIPSEKRNRCRFRGFAK